MESSKIHKLLKSQSMVKLIKLMIVTPNLPVSIKIATIKVCCILFVISL